MKNYCTGRIRSFAYAANGLRVFIRRGGNIWIHLLAASGVVASGLYFQVSRQSWLVLILCIFAVLAMEAMNTAIELLVDKIEPEKEELAGMIKDVSAGAVLLTAIGAALCGVLVFYPYLF